MTDNTAAQRQKALRARRKKDGLTLLRIYLPPALHPELKAIAKRMLAKHEKTNKNAR